MLFHLLLLLNAVFCLQYKYSNRQISPELNAFIFICCFRLIQTEEIFQFSLLSRLKKTGGIFPETNGIVNEISSHKCGWRELLLGMSLAKIRVNVKLLLFRYKPKQTNSKHFSEAENIFQRFERTL